MFGGHQRHVLGHSPVTSSRYGSAREPEQAPLHDYLEFRREHGAPFSRPASSAQEIGSLEDERGKVEELIGSVAMRINRVSHLVPSDRG